MANQPLLSIGMIVKNESRCLERCLKALQPLRDAIPCELVIADTGSTDNTREIAARYADILFDFEWINDFSAARNAVLEQCTGQWFLTVDADEYLQPDIQELVDFLHSPDAKKADYCSIIQRNYESIEINNDYSDFCALRLAKMKSGLRYYGIIHETFPIAHDSKLYSLNHTILDHDGYANLTPEHNRNKAQRNMELLEKELEKKPNDLRCWQQCLESSTELVSKNLEYAYRVMSLIQEEYPRNDEFWCRAPAMVRNCMEVAVLRQLPEVEEWGAWAKQTFPDSLYIQIDVNFYMMVHFRKETASNDMISLGQEYFNGIQKFQKIGSMAPELSSSSIYCATPRRKNYARTLLANALRENEQCSEALDVLGKIDFTNNKYNVPARALANLEAMAGHPKAAQIVKNVFLPVVEKQDDLSESEKFLKFLLQESLKHIFWQAPEEYPAWLLYRNFPSTIGLCAKLVDARSKEEAESLLAQIDDWDSFMPLALDRAMSLGATLPEGLYRMKPELLREIQIALLNINDSLSSYVIAYTAPETLTDWYHLCFAFDLLSAVWGGGNPPVEEYRKPLAERFAQVAAAFLQQYYSPALLADEERASRLMPLHRFTWYFVRAWEQRENGQMVEYVSTLRTALKQAEAMKPLVEYLLDEVKENEQKERIASASPELLSLAEQVRNILAAYPANDPAVLKLKESPAYQQVAFLIEEPAALAQ